MDKKDIIEKKTRILQAVLSYHFKNTIRTYYQGLEGFQKSLYSFYGKRIPNNREAGRYFALFSIPVTDIISPVKIDGKLTRITKEVLDNLKEFKFVGKKDIKCESGKEFRRPSFWLIDFQYARKILIENKPLEDYQPDEIKAINRFLAKQKEKKFVKETQKFLEEYCLPEYHEKEMKDRLEEYRLKRSQTNQDGVRLRSTVLDTVLPSLACNLT